MITLIITLAALIGYLLLGEQYVRLREVCRLTFFAGLLAHLLQYGAYFNFSIKGIIN